MKYILALLADFANGLFATLLAGYITGAEILWWHFLVGIALSMLPDSDALAEIFRRRGVVAAHAEDADDHRDYFHFPIIYLIVGLGLMWWNSYWGSMFLIGTMLHFFNDMYGTGWGVPLLWPFSRRRFKFLKRKANLLKYILVEKGLWETTLPAERKYRLIVSWSREELPEYIARFGIADWIEQYYLRLNWISLLEYGLFATAIILTIHTLVY